MRLTVVCLTILACVFSETQADPTTDARAVDEAIDRGVKYLLAQQDNDGTWGARGQSVGAATAVAASALMECGRDPRGPQMHKALTWLGKDRTRDPHSVALRCLSWQLANRYTHPKYQAELVKDVKQLQEYIASGGYAAKDDSNFRAAWMVHALKAGVRAGVEIPQDDWRKLLAHLTKTQAADDGWGYGAAGPSNVPMTAAALSAGHTCRDQLTRHNFAAVGKNVPFGPSTRGLAWLDRHFADFLAGKRPRDRQDLPTCLLDLQRLAMAIGQWRFGDRELFESGAAALLKRQQPDGSWASERTVVSTAMAMTFLARGKRPIFLARLQHKGDWNNRPHAVGHLGGWMGPRFCYPPLPWRGMDVKTSVDDWHEAPILLITGSTAPKFTAEDIKKLRLFVLRGGSVFSCTEGDGEGFKTGIRDTYRHLFPEHPLRACKADHVMYSRKLVFDLGNQVRFHELSNGVRPLAVHTDEDLPMSWQLRRTVTRRWAFQAIVNAVIYSVDTPWALPPYRAARWPEEPKEPPRRTLTLARLKHAGPHDPEPLAYERFTRKMAAEAKLAVKVVGPIDIKTLKTTGAAVATLTGTGTLKLSEDESAALKAFVNGGGTLVVDAAGGTKALADSAEAEIKRIFAPLPLVPLPPTAALYRLKGREIEKVRYRRRTKLRLGGMKTGNLKAVLLADGRAGVIFSREDITGGLVGYSSWTVDGYAPESAFAIMRNIVLQAGARDRR